jgi:chromosome segregation ATPase
MAEKTRAEIEHLKQNWLDDPCWDIERTEGFEDHHDELKAFHDGITEKRRQKDQAEHEARIAALDTKAGLGGNRALAEYIISLEDRIATIDRYTDRLSERIDENIDRVNSVGVPRRRYG